MSSTSSRSHKSSESGLWTDPIPTDGSVVSSEPYHSTPNRRCRKSVSFSSITHVISFDSPGSGKVLDAGIEEQSQRFSLSNSLDALHHHQILFQSHSLNSGTDTSSNLEHPFSETPSSCSEISLAYSPHDTYLSTPRKRSVTELCPEKAHPSPHHQARRGHPLLTPGEQHIILYTPAAVPPPEFCAETDRRVRSVLNYPSFDFSAHVLHRTYIVRNIQFSPSEECVVMLDKGVDSLLPSAFPPLPQYSTDAFAVGHVMDKGIGLFARRLIRNLEVILMERPAIITPYVIGLAVPLPQLYADIFGKLSTETFDDLIALLPSSQNDDKPPNYEDIIRPTALAIELAVPDEPFAELSTHRGVFLQTSKCNHSCCPNAKWEWDQSTFSLILTAVRQIDPGEEITIAYVPSHLPHQVRACNLRDIYAFECLCRICSQAPEQIEESDAARDMLNSFWDPISSGIPTFERWCTDHSIPSDVLIQAHRDAIHLIIREGLHELDTESVCGHANPERDLGRHVDRVAMCYGALEDVDNFRTWIQKALDARENSRPEQKLVLKKWLSNPVSFPAWGWRNNYCNGSSQFPVAMDSTKIMPS